MISARSIHKSYGLVEVLKGVDFEVDKGEIVSIVGASGAGKTTLLQILGTLDYPDRGSLQFAGKEITNLTDRALAQFRNQHIGFVFQFHHLLPEFTALENVCIPAYINKRAKKEAETKATEFLEFLNLAHRLHHKPSELSGGEQQRVAIARALINQPDLILADEPSGNLDSANAEELHQLFFKLREAFQQTFVIVTHNKTLADIADRKVEIIDGLINT